MLSSIGYPESTFKYPQQNSLPKAPFVRVSAKRVASLLEGEGNLEDLVFPAAFGVNHTYAKLEQREGSYKWIEVKGTPHLKEFSMKDYISCIDETSLVDFKKMNLQKSNEL